LSQYKKTILPGGIKVISESVPYLKSFSLGFWFDVGSRDEITSNNGITHFIEHMLFKGTQKRSARKIADEIESCGGYLNAFTSKEHTCYYGRGLSSHIERTFDVLSDMVQNPSFKPVDIKREASVVIDELYDIEDNPEELIFDKFEETVFKGSPLKMPVIGTVSNIEGFTQKDLFEFVTQKYGVDRMLIAASGAVNHEQIVELADKYIIKNFGMSNIKRKRESVKREEGFLKIIEKDIQQVHAIIGRVTCGYKEEKRTGISVFNQLFGEGSSSRLFQAVREKNGIGYQVNSFLNSFYDVSTFGVYLSTNEKMMDKALSIVYKEFKKIKEKKVSEKELEKAKESLKGGLILSLESTSNRMTRMAQSEIYFNRIKTVEESISRIETITAKDIQEIANELLDEELFDKIIIKSQKTKLKFAA
jgi:predicted Zn-dependent peptidase